MAEGGARTGPVPGPEAQKKEVGELLKSPLRKGDEWYLVDGIWFKRWKKYVGYDSWDMYNVGDSSVFPGPVDNSGLCIANSASGLLKEHLIDELDYVLLPAKAWGKLLRWYGSAEGQQPIMRKVVECGMFVKHCKVEVYLPELKLSENSDPDHTITRPFSKADTIGFIEAEMRNLFNIPAEMETRLWTRYKKDTYELLTKPENTVQDAGLYQGQMLVIEQRNANGSWPRDFLSNQSGLCGLSDLGKTSSMNSALQCLSNTPPLTRYFLTDQSQRSINTKSPRGEIAAAYAQLIRQIWSGKASSVAPQMIKVQVERRAPLFSGPQSPDDHQMLSFLLNALHEDLNRVEEKRAVERVEAAGRPDEVVAAESWASHLRRDSSIIVDLFHGLFRSTIVCPECHNVTVTFEPFSHLSLPLSATKESRHMELFLGRADPLAKPTQYRLIVPKSGTVSDLCVALYGLSGVPAEKMVVTDIYNHRFHRIFRADEMLSNISDRDDIFVFEVKSSSRDEDSAWIALPVCFRVRLPGTTSLFGLPLLISVPRHNLTADVLYSLVLERIRRYIKSPLPEEYLSATKRLFSFSLVNSATTEVSAMPPEGSALNLRSSDTVALDWDPETKKLYFDEEAAEGFVRDESVSLTANKKRSLGDCTRLLIGIQKLGERDPWSCPGCRKPQRATKKCDLWSLPKILVFHLKRSPNNTDQKAERVPEFPIRNLNMSGYVCDPMAGPHIYDLLAVSNHCGGGRYYTFAKNSNSQRWYHFADDKVSPIPTDQIVTKFASILFYQRRDGAGR